MIIFIYILIFILILLIILNINKENFIQFHDMNNYNYINKKFCKKLRLLDPKNEEAMYILIDLELERSNFSKVQDLKKDFKKICNTLCEKLTSIDTRLKDFEKKDAS